MMTFITNYNEAAMLNTLFMLNDGDLNPTTHTNTQREGEKKQIFIPTASFSSETSNSPSFSWSFSSFTGEVVFSTSLILICFGLVLVRPEGRFPTN